MFTVILINGHVALNKHLKLVALAIQGDANFSLLKREGAAIKLRAERIISSGHLNRVVGLGNGQRRAKPRPFAG